MSDKPPRSARSIAAFVGVSAFVIIMVTFWTWALFIARPDVVNRIRDTDWTAAAERRCATARAELDGLANYTELAGGGADLIRQRADIIEQANGVLTAMVDDLAATQPNDDKGKVLIPAWLTDYRIYLGDRTRYVSELRSTGKNLSFSETPTDQNLPISELLETFAADNYMPSCAPPRDLR